MQSLDPWHVGSCGCLSARSAMYCKFDKLVQPRAMDDGRVELGEGSVVGGGAHAFAEYWVGEQFFDCLHVLLVVGGVAEEGGGGAVWISCSKLGCCTVG